MKIDAEIIAAAESAAAALGTDLASCPADLFDEIVKSAAEAMDEDAKWVRVVLVDRIVSAGAG